MMGMCPRCGSETLALGNLTLEAANKKQIRTILRQCPKCGLLFYETAQV
jgi:ribosomal protein S27AE